MTNLLQQLVQDALGTQRGKAFEADAQPVLNDVTPYLVGIAQSSPTLAPFLAIAEAAGYKPPTATAQPLPAILSTTLQDILAIAQMFGHTPPVATVVPPTGVTLAQVATVVQVALTSLGLPAPDVTAIVNALETVATPSTGETITESEGLADLNAALGSIGLPAAGDAAFDAAFQTAWLAAGYPVPTSAG